MNSQNKFSTGVAILALLVAGVAAFLAFNAGGNFAGGNDHYQKESFMAGLFAGNSRQLDIDKSGQLLLGDNGTRFASIKTGSCTIWAPAATIGATTTQQVECQAATTGGITRISGITADSVCSLRQASTTPGATAIGGLVVAGSSASSTVVSSAGTIVGKILNLTGTTFTWGSTASSSPYWQYTCFDPA